jgi:hypothetical protein
VRQARGALGRIADSVAGSLRRRQQTREPRAVVFDAGGHPRRVPPGSAEHRALIETAERLVELAGAGAREER